MYANNPQSGFYAPREDKVRPALSAVQVQPEIARELENLTEAVNAVLQDVHRLAERLEVVRDTGAPGAESTNAPQPHIGSPLGQRIWGIAEQVQATRRNLTAIHSTLAI